MSIHEDFRNQTVNKNEEMWNTWSLNIEIFKPSKAHLINSVNSPD